MSFYTKKDGVVDIETQLSLCDTKEERSIFRYLYNYNYTPDSLEREFECTGWGYYTTIERCIDFLNRIDTEIRKNKNLDDYWF